MFLRLIIFSLTYILVWTSSKSCIAQIEKSPIDRIENGKEFLSKVKNDWLNCLDQAPYVIGKMTFQSDRLIECWRSKDHSRRIVHHANGTKELLVLNPEYVAEIRITNGNPNLTFVTPAKKPAPFPDTFLLALSCTPDGTLIPYALEGDRIEIVDFESSNGLHLIKFLPKQAYLGWEALELRFNDTTGPLPDRRLVKYRDGSYELASHHDFLEIGGFRLPERFGSKKSQSKELSFADEPIEFCRYKYDPEDKLIKGSCYLKYYGLPEPIFGEVANFSERGWNIKRGAWFVIAGVGIGLLFFWIWRSDAAR